MPRWMSAALKAVFRRAGPLTLTALLLLLPMAAAGQQTGQVVGEVINGQDGQAMANVQVTIRGTALGGLTNTQGRFLIRDVPVGEQTVVAQLIGYSEQRATVNVTDGGTADAGTIEIFPSAVELEGLVVTGTAMAQQKREIGNSISTVTEAEIEAVGAMNFEDLLRGRASGVSVTGTPGSAGAGSSILLRGTNSVNGRNLPLIYIDGVRMPAGVLETSTGEAEEHATFLGSIRPEDIERIEVIKGAAASAIYGTDAAAGVIQIFTKRGAEGPPQWTFSMEQGFATVGHVGPDLDPTGLHVNDCTRQFVYDPETDRFSTLDEPDPGCPDSGSWLRNAHVQDYALSVRGGSEDVTYYVSAGWGDEEGVVAPNEAQDLNVRGNFTFNGFENFQISLNNFYTRRDIRWIPNGDNSEGLLFNVARGVDGETPDNDDSLVLDMELNQIIDHYNTAGNISWTPTDAIRSRLTIGLDYNRSHYVTMRPWQYWSNPEGDRTIDIENQRTITADFATSWRAELPSSFTSTLSVGAQYNQNEQLGNRTDVEGFIGPASHHIENARVVTNVNEDRLAVESGGFFIQEQIGWNNRLFVTGSVRADAHSSFGSDYQADHTFTYYPKLQATYTVSDHTFWPSWFETFRVRAAYGESGEAPPRSGSVTIWENAGADDNKLGFIIQNVANPDLGPERTREYEAGFDASLLNGRIALNTTVYQRDTYDGLIFVAPPPSNGIAESFPQNVGEWQAKGVEAGLDLLVWDGLNARVNLNANYQYNETKMIDLGDPQFDSFDFNYLNSYRPGRPIPALYGRKVTNADAVGELPIYSDEDTLFFGPTRPPHEIALGTTVTLWDRVTLDAYGIGQYGHVLYDDLAQELAVDGLWPACWPINEAVKAGEISDLTAGEIARCSEDYSDNEDWIEDADYFRLQSASISYQVPVEWLPRQFTGAAIQLRGTNLFTITDFSGLYPDALIRPAQQTARGAGYILPPARRFTLNLRLNF